MNWLPVLLLSCLAGAIIAKKTTPLKIRIKSEAAKLDNGLGHVRIEFEANANVDVTWCQEIPSSRGYPPNCVSLGGNPNYQIRKDVSLFYFSYVGSASITTLLTPFKRPPVLRIISKQGNLHIDHKVIANDLDLQGKVQISRSKVSLPEVITALPPSVNHKKTPLIQCSVQSKHPMEVTWLMTSAQGTVPLFQFDTKINKGTKTINGETYEGAVQNKKSGEGITTQAVLEISSSKTQGDVITCVFTEANRENVNTVHMSTIAE